MFSQVRRGVLLLTFGLGMALASTAAAENVLVQIDGLYCGLCSGGLSKHLKETPGIKRVDLLLQDGQILLTPDGTTPVQFAQLKAVVDSSTYAYKGIRIRGSGKIESVGGSYVFVASGTGNRYHLASSSGGVFSKIKNAASSSDNIALRGTVQQSNGGYVLEPTSVE